MDFSSLFRFQFGFEKTVGSVRFSFEKTVGSVFFVDQL